MRNEDAIESLLIFLIAYFMFFLSHLDFNLIKETVRRRDNILAFYLLQTTRMDAIHTRTRASEQRRARTHNGALSVPHN